MRLEQLLGGPPGSTGLILKVEVGVARRRASRHATHSRICRVSRSDDTAQIREELIYMLMRPRPRPRLTVIHKRGSTPSTSSAAETWCPVSPKVTYGPALNALRLINLTQDGASLSLEVDATRLHHGPRLTLRPDAPLRRVGGRGSTPASWSDETTSDRRGEGVSGSGDSEVMGRYLRRLGLRWTLRR